MSFSLPRTLAAWQTPAFADTFKEEMSGVDLSELPLLGLMQYGSAVVGHPKFMILGTTANSETLQIRTGVFFQSVLAGCNCSDDPTAPDTNNEYGELELMVDRASASTRVHSN